MLNRAIAFFSMVGAVILVSMLFFMTPASIGPIGIFIFFSMAYVVLLGVATLIVGIFRKFVSRRKMNTKDYAYAAILAFWPVMVLVIISVGTSNIIVPLVGATASVALFMFLIKKV